MDLNQYDPMVITVEVANFSVRKTSVGQRSSADIIYYLTFKKLGIPKNSNHPYDNKHIGFSGEQVDTRGYVDLLTTFGTESLSQTISV